MKVVSITVNYQTPKLTIGAIQSEISDISRLRGCIIIVDNDSRDGSFQSISDEVLHRGWGKTVEVIEAPKNGGFGYGVNVAFRTLLKSGEMPDYFYLLGPDAQIDEGSLERLVAFMDSNPHVGIAGSKTFNADGSPRISAFRFPSILSELEEGLRWGICSRILAPWTVRKPIPNLTTAVDWVSAASLIIRQKVLRKTETFDESFFLYFEETDLCRRSKLAGWPTHYVVESTSTHIGQASTGLNDLKRPRPNYWFESRRHYFLKHHGPFYLWCANFVNIIARFIWQIRRRLQGKPDADPPRFLRDFVRHSFWPIDAPRWRVNATSGPTLAHDTKPD